jgi:hypothetical protein
MSTLKTTNLQNASAASPAFVLASDGSATANLSSLNGGPIAGSRNRIINGDMRIDQRNAGASVTVANGSTAYTLDRWLSYTGGSNVLVQRVGLAGAFSLQMTGAAGNTGIQLLQRIEALNIADLASQVVTFSFTISSSSLTTVGAFYNTPTATDNFNSLNSTQTISGSIPVTSTPTRQSISFTLPASVVNGFQLFFQTGAFTSGTLTLTNVQLEPGSVATPFERRSYGAELALCQRYYETIGISANGGFVIPFGYTPSASQQYNSNLNFKVTKRAIPTVTKNGGSWNSLNSGQMGFYNPDVDAVLVYAISVAAGQAYTQNTVGGQYISISAEL